MQKVDCLLLISIVVIQDFEEAGRNFNNYKNILENIITSSYKLATNYR